MKGDYQKEHTLLLIRAHFYPARAQAQRAAGRSNQGQELCGQKSGLNTQSIFRHHSHWMSWSQYHHGENLHPLCQQTHSESQLRETAESRMVRRTQQLVADLDSEADSSGTVFSSGSVLNFSFFCLLIRSGLFFCPCGVCSFSISCQLSREHHVDDTKSHSLI
jgi:hypothetical protein